MARHVGTPIGNSSWPPSVRPLDLVACRGIRASDLLWRPRWDSPWDDQNVVPDPGVRPDDDAASPRRESVRLAPFGRV